MLSLWNVVSMEVIENTDSHLSKLWNVLSALIFTENTNHFKSNQFLLTWNSLRKNDNNLLRITVLNESPWITVFGRHFSLFFWRTRSCKSPSVLHVDHWTIWITELYGSLNYIIWTLNTELYNVDHWTI